jgi:hypothetical protein
MYASPRFSSLHVALIAAATAAAPTGASAVTVEVAKKCDTLTAKAFPPRVPGNPAAGTANGTGLAAQNYHRQCIDNGGNVDNKANTGGTGSPSGTGGAGGK